MRNYSESVRFIQDFMGDGDDHPDYEYPEQLIRIWRKVVQKQTDYSIQFLVNNYAKASNNFSQIVINRMITTSLFYDNFEQGNYEICFAAVLAAVNEIS